MTQIYADPLQGMSEHLARVDGLLMALESELNVEGRTAEPFSREDVPPAPPASSPDPICWIMRRFSLTEGEVEFFRLAVAAELSPSIGATYAQMQGDRRFRRPQVSFALRLLEPDPVKRMRLLPLLHEEGALRRYSLLELSPPWRDRTPLFMELELTLPTALLFQLSGHLRLDSSVTPFATLFNPPSPAPPLTLPSNVAKALERMLETHPLGKDGRVCPSERGLPFVYVFGEPGSGRTSITSSLADAWRLRVLKVDVRAMPEDALVPTTFTLLKREAQRLDAVLFFANLERLFERPMSDEQQPPDPMRLDRILSQLVDYEGPLVMGATLPPPPSSWWYRRPFTPLLLTTQHPLEVSDALWQAAIDDMGHRVQLESAVPVFHRYPFTPGLMRDAVRAAYSYHLSTGATDEILTGEDVRQGCLSQLRHNLDALSKRARSKLHWDDLILPETIKTQLRMLEGFIHHREKVYEQWGLGRRISAGRGVKALLCGASGTGKTMAAGVIASHLGLELYKIDVSALVSKWVGETEKNLDRIFTEAQRSHAIILFDEADSIFGKRGSVEKSSDRYSNMEVNFLLQRFEEYDGGVILTSNFPRGIDDAFSRRMHFIIEFPMPDADMRRLLWKSMLPAELPLAKDVDLERLVQQFELSGGNIQNIILGAAFIAAERQSSVGMLDLMRALQWEFQKMGRSTSRGEFKEYFDLLT